MSSSLRTLAYLPHAHTTSAWLSSSFRPHSPFFANYTLVSLFSFFNIPRKTPIPQTTPLHRFRFISYFYPKSLHLNPMQLQSLQCNFRHGHSCPHFIFLPALFQTSQPFFFSPLISSVSYFILRSVTFTPKTINTLPPPPSSLSLTICRLSSFPLIFINLL